MITKEEFNKVWKDSTKEDILNQFYYEHIAIRKAIEYINTHDDCFYQEKGLNEDSLNDLLSILLNGGEENDTSNK